MGSGKKRVLRTVGRQTGAQTSVGVEPPPEKKNGQQEEKKKKKKKKNGAAPRRNGEESSLRNAQGNLIWSRHEPRRRKKGSRCETPHERGPRLVDNRRPGTPEHGPAKLWPKRRGKFRGGLS